MMPAPAVAFITVDNSAKKAKFSELIEIKFVKSAL